MAKINKTLITPDMVKEELARRVQKKKEKDSIKLFDKNEFCFPAQLKFLNDESRFKAACCSRRAGKCLKEGTPVLTPSGIVEIQNLKVGDIVYGFNEDHTISLTTVTALVNQGIKDVVDIKQGNKVILSCTTDHPLVTVKDNKIDLQNLKEVDDFNRTSLHRAYITVPGGRESFKYAYLLGTVLGDECSDASKRNIPLYDQWAHNKYAHEKIAEYDIIKQWDRQSQLQFLAGLFDTDGSTSVYNNRLEIRLDMQAKSVIDCAKKIIEHLFQVNCNISMDNRDKCVNGTVHSVTVETNEESKRVLKEMSQYMLCERKQWKDEYELLYSQNLDTNSYGLKNISESYKAQCWDITVNNTSHLFLLANGIVSHNTLSIAADLVHDASRIKDSIFVYITISFRNAKSIIWSDLKKICDDFKLNVKINENNLSIYFVDTRSEIRCTGCSNASEIEKFRGWKIKKAYLDEVQSIKSYAKNLVEDVLMPTLRDQRGTLAITGTPAPSLVGFFYEVCHSNHWSQHHWTAFENPHMLELEKTLEEERRMRGIAETDPSYIRETYGEWVNDENSLVHKFDKQKNIYHRSEVNLSELNYVLGIDIGSDDADAIAVIGYNLHGQVYLVNEFVKSKQTVTELADKVKEFQDIYKPVKMVIDAGALGKKIADEIRTRHGLPIEAAEKERKMEFIELLNDDLRTGRFKAFEGSQFEEDSYYMSWETKANGNRVVSDRFHSDIADAVLYAWRESMHFINEKRQLKLESGSPAWAKKEEEEMIAALEKKVNEDLHGEDELGVDQHSINDIFGYDDF